MNIFIQLGSLLGGRCTMIHGAVAYNEPTAIAVERLGFCEV
ncbi:MAG: hypothetical protein ACJAZO_003387 [Myxococcota bacterium]|jgi:hypothetical protein